MCHGRPLQEVGARLEKARNDVCKRGTCTSNLCGQMQIGDDVITTEVERIRQGFWPDSEDGVDEWQRQQPITKDRTKDLLYSDFHLRYAESFRRFYRCSFLFQSLFKILPNERFGVKILKLYLMRDTA